MKRKDMTKKKEASKRARQAGRQTGRKRRDEEEEKDERVRKAMEKNEEDTVRSKEWKKIESFSNKNSSRARLPNGKITYNQ